ncbi:hypothetical protein BC628DRAFT_623424 [Trametes gibbosa]|nr:hypothetical protein BC628DRAFT_623424 [Trametes gibbosa]
MLKGIKLASYSITTRRPQGPKLVDRLRGGRPAGPRLLRRHAAARPALRGCLSLLRLIPLSLSNITRGYSGNALGKTQQDVSNRSRNHREPCRLSFATIEDGLCIGVLVECHLRLTVNDVNAVSLSHTIAAYQLIIHTLAILFGLDASYPSSPLSPAGLWTTCGRQAIAHLKSSVQADAAQRISIKLGDSG